MSLDYWRRSQAHRFVKVVSLGSRAFFVGEAGAVAFLESRLSQSIE